MKRLMILAAAIGCTAAATGDHAFIERGFAHDLRADLENKDADGKTVWTRLRVKGADGEGCETRLDTDKGVVKIDWRKVYRLQLAPIRHDGWLFLRGGIEADRVIFRFKSVEDGTPVMMAMERLQAACKPAG